MSISQNWLKNIMDYLKENPSEKTNKETIQKIVDLQKKEAAAALGAKQDINNYKIPPYSNNIIPPHPWKNVPPLNNPKWKTDYDEIDEWLKGFNDRTQQKTINGIPYDPINLTKVAIKYWATIRPVPALYVKVFNRTIEPNTFEPFIHFNEKYTNIKFTMKVKLDNPLNFQNIESRCLKLVNVDLYYADPMFQVFDITGYKECVFLG